MPNRAVDWLRPHHPDSFRSTALLWCSPGEVEVSRVCSALDVEWGDSGPLTGLGWISGSRTQCPVFEALCALGRIHLEDLPSFRLPSCFSLRFVRG